VAATNRPPLDERREQIPLDHFLKSIQSGTNQPDPDIESARGPLVAAGPVTKLHTMAARGVGAASPRPRQAVAL
jgi:hypothetical protein